MIKSQNTARNILFCLLVALLGILASSFSTVADRMAAAQGRPAASVGLYLSLFAAGSFMSVPFGSVLADWQGKEKIIRAAILVLAAGLTIIAFSGRTAFLYAGLFLMGTGFGPTESMSSALLADENPENASRWMSLSQIGFGIGAVAAPVMIAGYMRRPGAAYGNIFALCAGLFLILFTVIYATGRREPRTRENARFQMNLFSVLKSRKLRAYALMIFCYLGFESVAPAYLKQLSLAEGTGESFASMMISLFWASMILCRFIGAFLGGKELSAIKVLCVVIIAGITVLLSAKARPVFIVGVFLFGFGCGSIWPMLVALAARVFPERSGAACGIMMLFSTAGGTLFPVVIGSWAGNPRVTFMLCAVLAACVLLGASLTGCQAKRDSAAPRGCP